MACYVFIPCGTVSRFFSQKVQVLTPKARQPFFLFCLCAWLSACTIRGTQTCGLSWRGGPFGVIPQFLLEEGFEGFSFPSFCNPQRRSPPSCEVGVIHHHLAPAPTIYVKNYIAFLDDFLFCSFLPLHVCFPNFINIMLFKLKFKHFCLPTP